MENKGYTNMPEGFGTVGSNGEAYKGYKSGGTGKNDSSVNNSDGTNQSEKADNVKQAAKASGKKTGLLEGFIGRNLMGIFASVLVIVGLILLVTAASEYITDVIKVAIIYAASFAMLIAGLLGNRKFRNGFFMSLAGCGVGAVYISIFLTFGYFELVNVLVMFIMAAVWSIIVFFLGGRESALFHITGQSGLLVSLCFGMVEVMNNRMDQPEVFSFALLFFYMCVTVFYAILDRNGKIGEAITVFIMNLIGLIFMFIAYSKVVVTYDVWQQIMFTGVLLLYSFWLTFISYMKFGRIKPVAVDAVTGEVIKEEGSATGWSVFYGFNVFLTSMCLSLCCEIDQTPSWLIPLVGLVYVMISWMFVGLRRRDDAAFTACSVVSLVWSVIYITGLSTVADLFGVGLVILPLLILAFLTKSKTLMIMDVASVILFAFHDAQYPAVYTLLMLLFLLSSTAAIIIVKEFKASVYKICLIAAATIFLFRVPEILVKQYDLVKVTAQTFAYALFVIMNTCLLSYCLKTKRNKTDYDYSLHIILNTLNVAGMIYGVGLIFASDNIVVHIINLVLLFVLVFINMPDMARNKNTVHSLYNVIKLTMFAVVTIQSFDMDAFVITLACLVVSITSIILGFISESKVIRIYGLILSIVSIVKLLLFDLSFDSDIARALVVMLCGVIAFAICLVYNIVQKRLEEDNHSDK